VRIDAIITESYRLSVFQVRAEKLQLYKVIVLQPLWATMNILAGIFTHKEMYIADTKNIWSERKAKIVLSGTPESS
jgi:hypothetical protein